MSYQVIRIPTDNERVKESMQVQGTYLRVLAVPGGINGAVSLDSQGVTARYDLARGLTHESCEGFRTMYLSHDALPGGEIVLWVGNGDRLEVIAELGDIAQVAQGAAGAEAWPVSDPAVVAAIGSAADAEATGNGTVIALLKRLRTILGAPTDAEAAGDGAVVGILKRMRTLLGDLLAPLTTVSDAWGLYGYRAANPAPVDSTMTGVAVLVDVAAVLGRVGYRGYVAAHQDNAGEVTVEASYNGVAWVQLGVLPAGAGLSLEGVAVDSLRLTGTAGDRVLGEVH